MASIVQVKTIGANTASNLSVAFDSPVTPGNAIYCVGSCIIGPGLVQTFTFNTFQDGVFDVIDNQLSLDTTPMSNSVKFGAVGGATTVNMTLLYPHAGDDFCSQMIIAEVEGVYALDPGLPLQPSHILLVNDAWPTPGTPLDLSPVTAALATPFIIAACVSINNPANVYTAGSGYTIPTGGQIDTTWSGPGEISCLGIESQQLTVAGLYTPTIVGSQQPTFTSFFGVNCVATFAVGSGPPPPPTQSNFFSPCGKMPTVELTRDLDSEWGDRSTFFITQSDPMPFTLRGLVLRITYNTD